MSVTFAYRWNWDYDKGADLKVNGKAFGYADARALLKLAVNDPVKGVGLKGEVDNGLARVVRAPHKTDGGDTRLHMSVHCKIKCMIYHIYISKNGNYSGLEQEPVSGMKPKTGHVNDDYGAPAIANSAAL
jgi:hypothetical protein